MTLTKIGDVIRLRTKALNCANRLMHVGLCLLLMCGLVHASDLSLDILENQPADTEVGVIEDGTDLYVAAKTKGVDDAFDINILEATGSIITSKQLDREDIEQYNMTIYHTVSGITTTVTINVIDENDNAPTFAENAITIEISELSKVGFEVNLGSALDEDAPPLNVQGYRLVEDSEFFDVVTTLLDNGQTRYAALVVLKKLDRETSPHHIVTVEAFDGGTPTPKTGNITVNVTVSDSNDNAPHFQYSSYNTSISESTNVPIDIIKVKATDKDVGINGDITYSIDRSKSDPDKIFEINAESGQIYLNKKLDSELAAEHRLTVLATDGGAQPLVGSTLVIVKVEDINDNEPVINIIFLGSSDGKVSEAAAIGDYVARISVSDPDIGDVERFNVSISGGDGRFGLKTENNVVYLVCVKEVLDRENKSSYDIELIATDFGSPPKSASVSITIEIEDINDNPPEFGQSIYSVNISEDSFPGTFVIHLDAADPDLGINSQFSFDLLSSNQSDWFSLNRETGLITTRTYLDHEINPQPVLQVVATDFGTPRMSSVTTVIVNVGDLNDSAPKFVNSTYRVTVSEDADEQSCFLQVKATDPDFPSQAQQVTYSFADEAPGAISLSFAGKLCLVSRLDREKIPTYEIRVKATDQGGLHDFAQVHIIVADINDNRPIFHPVSYVANVASATALAGNPVTRVMATDDDEKADRGFGNVTYEILAGNNLELFALDEDTGEISVARSLVNHGSMVIQLRIRATDGGGLSSESDAIVTVSVLDGNTSSGDGPVFGESLYEFMVKENVDQDTVIGMVAATSIHGTVTYTIREDPPMSSWFDVNPVSGDIVVTSFINREIYSSVTLQIMGSVGHPPVFGFTTLSITVEDVNDNRPVFIAESPNANPVEGGIIRTVTIPYSLPIGSLIYDVKATDADDGMNSLVRYTLVDNSSYFQIDLTSGRLGLKNDFPKRNGTYSVVIQASDLGNPPLSSTGIVVVKVLQPDVNCPAFSADSYTFSIAEDFPLALSFDEIQATSHSKVFYEILPNAESYNFAIFPNGFLYLTSALDREFKDSYAFQVQAFGPPSADFTKPCITTATVLISIIDVNDNVPYFDLESRIFYVNENEPTGTVIGVVSATDNDIGDNAELRYSFAMDNENFEIDGISGIIRTLKILDRESFISHTLTVQATDISSSPSLSQITIRVLVEDVNDVSPSFLTSTDVSLLCVVQERKEKGTFVCLLQAVDNDSGQNGKISYSILSGDEGFEINAVNGRVTTTRLLIMNDQDLYSLVVRAEDHGIPPKSATATVQIHVRTSDDNPAVFDENNYVFFVPVLNAGPGQNLGRFNTLHSTQRVRRQLESDVVLTNFQIVSGDDKGAFYLNETDGSLTSLTELNYERKPQYLLTVTAEHSQDSSATYTLQAQVNIEDANDFAPTFSSASYTFSIQENLPVGSKIWTFSAIDKDIGMNGVLSFSILSESSSHPGAEESSTAFRIDPSSGELYTQGDIDRESIPEYTLVIQAADNGDVPRSTTVSCVITVRDMNDHRPMFVSRSSVYVMEDEPIGFPIVCLAAEDDDFGANSHVSFSIVRAWTDVNHQTDQKEYFHLNSATGLLTLTKQLDFETAMKHYINVSATDGAASDSLTDYQLLVVNVIDVNDQIPKFVKTVYQAEISEDKDVGSLVTRATANDGDSGENGKVSYELQDRSNVFSIDKDTGVIVTADNLDRELQDSYTLIVFAYDGAFPALYDWCTVEIAILDINDNLPHFAMSATSESGIPLLVTLHVPEYENGPALIHTVVATDSDMGENGKLRFAISDGNTDDRFTINSTTGELWTNTRLDREEISLYRLKITATDNGTPNAKSSDAYVDVSVLDWNDNDPAFSQSSYHGSVSEGLPIGQFVLTVHADDPDSELNGEITYSIEPDSDALSSNGGCFSVDSQTGAITTTSILDREKKKQYQLIIQAMDSAPYGPRKSSATVLIDVNDINDNSPIFDEKLVERNVTESTETGAEVAKVQAQDKDEGDNGTVFYQITGGNTLPFGSGLDKFHIHNDGRITTTDSLTGTYTYYLNVTAHDNGNPTRTSEAVVIINVVPFDVPNFSRIQFLKSVYKADIPETMQKGNRVTQVEARLYIDESEVDESDSVSIVYSFPSGNEDGTFSINSAGIITIKDPSFLDYEELPSIHLIVRAAAIPANAQGVTYDYTTVYVNLEDDNDNSPQFAQDRYVTKVWEQQDAGIYVLQVSAHDIDSNENGEVRYYINSGNIDQSFQVDQVTGIVTTALTLDREIHQEYKLIVHAYDLGAPRRTGSCTLKISVVDINDHKPTLTVPSGNSPLNIPESLDVGSMITRVTANDPDSGSEITFALDSKADETNKFFSIDRFSGKIYLAEEVDYETMHDTTITVMASDGTFTDRADILINLIDENDNAPEFILKSYQATLDELSSVNTSVIKVKATDADSEDNGLVSYKLIDTLPKKPMFIVDPVTGVIYTNMTEAFNPQTSIYNLIIQAEDHGDSPLQSSVSVRIQIEDVNNFPPVFSQESYEASVSEAAERDTHVINITATDADFSKENRYVYYEISAGNFGDAFKIITHTASGGENTFGEIAVANDLDRENVSAYQLTIRASDQGTPRMMSEKNILVKIRDVNDNKPVFNQTSYRGEISEHAKQEPVLMVFASDPDSSSHFIFKITSGNDDAAFDIGECIPSSEGCALISAKILNYEEKSEYKLAVQVWDDRDTSTARSSVVPVIIDILDVNEHTPYFPIQFKNAKIDETVHANQSLFSVSAVDGDGGFYGKINYFIAREDNIDELEEGCLPAYEMFEVIQATGEVKSRHDFDYESCQQYSFHIRAQNSGGAGAGAKLLKASFLLIVVEVNPIDEFPPVFAVGNINPFRFSVPYGSPPGHIVGMVNATDADAGSDGKIAYEIDKGDQDQEFRINATTGTITLIRSLESSSNRILSVTASSGKQRIQTFVSIEITGAPAIALEAQILAIVFGVIAAIAVIIVLVLCLKHRRNKKALRYPHDSSTNAKEESEYYDLSLNRNRRDGNPVAAPRMATVNKTGKITSSSAEYQAHHVNGISPSNAGAPNSISTNGRVHSLENGTKSKSLSCKASGHSTISNGHIRSGMSSTTVTAPAVAYRIPRQSTSSGRGSEQDDDEIDREVDQITSSSETMMNRSTSLPKPKTRRKSPGKGRSNKPVLDSGIQQDIDACSDISDGPNNIRPASVESMHIFEEEGAGEARLDLQDIENDLEIANGMKDTSRTPASYKERSLTSKFDYGHGSPSYKSPLGTEKSVGSARTSRGTEGPDFAYNRRDHLVNWAPEFQPLANVFSEYARFKEESSTRARNRDNIVMRDLSVVDALPSGGNNMQSQVPPPLITAVTDQRNNIIAPVPMGCNINQTGRRGVANNPVGLYPQSNPHYMRTSNNYPTTSYLPPLYSSAHQRPDNLPSTIPTTPGKAQVSFARMHVGLGQASLNSSQQALSVSSLSRTPISHESSFTSPAMSPNLSQSLSPLATRSPSVSPYTVSDVAHAGVSDSSETDPRSCKSVENEERMVHV